MRRPNNNLPADIRLICGTTGAGKSHGVKQVLKAERGAVLAFDVKNEYGDLPGFRTVYTRTDLVAAARQGGRVAYPNCSTEEFDFWCAVVWARGDCLAIAEELAGYTTVSKASGYWHKILTQGRGFGIRPIGLTQRPCEIDKTIVGLRSMMRVHRLERADDRKYAAKELDIPQALVDALQGHEFIEKSGSTLILPQRLRSKGHAMRELPPAKAKKAR